MVHLSPDAPSKEDHRGLRLTTILAFLPTFALLLPYGILSARPLPTVGIAMMFFSAVFGSLVLATRVRSTSTKVCMDLLLAVLILAILIPSWIFLGQRHWSWRSGRLIVLGTYGTVPMMLNCAIHFYLAFHTLGTRLSFRARPIKCPNCHHEIVRTQNTFRDGASAVKETGGYQDAPNPPMSFYDEARASSEFQTSGFNTPRQSAETLEDSPRTSRDLLNV